MKNNYPCDSFFFASPFLSLNGLGKGRRDEEGEKRRARRPIQAD